MGTLYWLDPRQALYIVTLFNENHQSRRVDEFSFQAVDLLLVRVVFVTLQQTTYIFYVTYYVTYVVVEYVYDIFHWGGTTSAHIWIEFKLKQPAFNSRFIV
jgi:hypothetical protein